MSVCLTGPNAMTGQVQWLSVALLAVVLALGFPSLDGYLSQTQVLDDKPDKTERDLDNLVVQVDLVNVLFTVTDRKGKLVTDLEKNNLKIYEDNKLQTITNFTRETDRNQYTLGYKPTNTRRDGTWRTVTVKLNNTKSSKKVVARTKHGYYAPTES
jgi:hypothetical protein